jgi:hypothetical protein
MTRQTHNEMLQLSLDLLELSYGNIEQNDVWSFIWGNQHYSAQRYYQHHFAAVRPTRHVLWIWKSKCMPRIKFFAWLPLNDRLNTRNMLRRRKQFLQEGYSYVLCHGSVKETMEHHFFIALQLVRVCLLLVLSRKKMRWSICRGLMTDKTSRGYLGWCLVAFDEG